MDRLVGQAIDREVQVRILELLDFKVHGTAGAAITVSVPPYRVDVHREADVVEEILQYLRGRRDARPGSNRGLHRRPGWPGGRARLGERRSQR